MKKTHWYILSVLLLGLLVAGCASAPESTAEATPADEQPAEEAQSSDAAASETGEDTSRPMSETVPAFRVGNAAGSFSPRTTAGQDLTVSGTDGQPIQEWELTVRGAAGNEVYRESGTGEPPQAFSWNGTVDGQVAPEGAYTATLDTVFEDGSSRTDAGRPFLLDMTMPQPSLRLQGVPFSPNGDRVRDELIVTIDAQDASPIVAWLFEIQTLEGETLAQFTDESDVPRTARWNGRSGGGLAVESGQEYQVVGGVRDAAGNEGVAESRFVVGALTEEYRGGQRIILPRIQFPANSARLADASPEDRRTFDQVIARTVRILNNQSDMRILIEGHANATRFTGSTPNPQEQRTELIPLSRERAEVVRQELVRRGIDGSRLETRGVGAEAPLGSFADPQGQRRNRRIALYVTEE